MKRFILLIMMLLPLGAMAQSPHFSALMTEYSTQEGCTTLNISNAMFQSLQIDIDAESMKVISIENQSLIPRFREQIKELVAPLNVLMSVNANNESVEIYQRSEEGRIKELYIITYEGSSCVALYIYGDNLEINQVNSLIEVF